MTYEMESEAETMCNLSDGVEKRGIKKGIQQGIQQGMDTGTMNALLGYIRKKKVSIEAALEDLDIPVANHERYSALLREQLHGV